MTNTVKKNRFKVKDWLPNDTEMLIAFSIGLSVGTAFALRSVVKDQRYLTETVGYLFDTVEILVDAK